MLLPKFSLVLCLFTFLTIGFGLKVTIECDDPIVLGATLNCTATIQDDSGNPASGDFQYSWRDNSIPQNTRFLENGSNVDHWSVTYNRSNYQIGGLFVLRVDVCKWIFLHILCQGQTSSGYFFAITDTFNGQLTQTQNNETRKVFVATNTSIQNSISLKKSDQEFLKKAPSVLTYWFVDCIYYGITTDLSFNYTFAQSEQNHNIEVLVVADFTPLPPTTTLQPITTTIPSNVTTPTPATTTIKPKTRTKRDNLPLNNNTIFNQIESNIKIWQNGTLVPYNVSFPYVCNGSIITTDHNKVYGHFIKTFTTKDPISNISVSGNNWLQQGELLSLNVNCKGSKEMEFCYYFKKGLYNVTGNETCSDYRYLEQCDFPIQRYFIDQHTVIIIIKNDVSKQITSVAVTVYKVKHQPQLSIIVVPVAFSLAAVVTIVFGVAYYLQNRSRFIIEVADFDFGPKYADMEYKTFKDRLKDSITNAFNRDPEPSTSDAPLWPPGQKYGSMK
ncbi:hypothetical protein ABEB36_000848 [Hypothenemus hampei]|uniref:Transmembrane protein n=1 Tax=Hypothenemus hampei TaxID=57062 RepID=A0ABD1FEH8_HYPHA